MAKAASSNQDLMQFASFGSLAIAFISLAYYYSLLFSASTATVERYTPVCFAISTVFAELATLLFALETTHKARQFSWAGLFTSQLILLAIIRWLLMMSTR